MLRIIIALCDMTSVFRNGCFVIMFVRDSSERLRICYSYWASDVIGSETFLVTFKGSGVARVPSTLVMHQSSCR